MGRAASSVLRNGIRGGHGDGKGAGDSQAGLRLPSALTGEGRERAWRDRHRAPQAFSGDLQCAYTAFLKVFSTARTSAFHT